MWFKVDDGFPTHPKVYGLSARAIGVWTIAGALAAQHLTDGHVVGLPTIGRRSDADELVEHGLWEPDGRGGWVFHDWADINPTREQWERQREGARQRKAKSRRDATVTRFPGGA